MLTGMKLNDTRIDDDGWLPIPSSAAARQGWMSEFEHELALPKAARKLAARALIAEAGWVNGLSGVSGGVTMTVLPSPQP